LKNYLNKLKKTFEKLSVDVKINSYSIDFKSNEYFLFIGFYAEALVEKDKVNLPIDYLVNQFDKVVYFIQSKLHLNKTVYARSCEIKKIDKLTAADFLDKYHFLNNASGAFNYGLFHNNELLGVASFSKGRKMNRLQEHERGFELTRFCTKGGITITGGLSKLIKHFCNEKNPGDIMTYIDKQFSEGKSFINSGFKLHSVTESNYFLIDKITFERFSTKLNETFDEKIFYKTSNSGNLKLVYTPKKLL
jgi:hypothetical protein